MKLIYSIAFFLLFVSNLTSQVTIGNAYPPLKGALLQLKENENIQNNSNKGLMLPRIALVDIDNLYPMFLEADGSVATSYVVDKEKIDMLHTGLIVHNVTNKGANLCNGLYIWDGKVWQMVNKKICEYIEVSPHILNFPAIGSTLKHLTVSSNISWQSLANITDLHTNKISTFSPPANVIQASTENSEVNIGINLGDNGIDQPAREFQIVIEGHLSDGTLTHIPIVLQQTEGAKSHIFFSNYSGIYPPNYQSIDTDGNMTINIANDGNNGSGTYSIESNIPWSITYQDTGNNGHNTLIQSTIPTQNVESPVGSSLTFNPNQNGIGCPSRSAQLKLLNETYAKSIKLTVTQDAGIPFVLAGSSPYVYSKSGGNYPINVASNKNYQITSFDNNSGIMNYAGNGIVYPAGTATFNLGINTNEVGCTARSGSVTISSTPDCGTTQSVVIPFTQAAGDNIFLNTGDWAVVNGENGTWNFQPSTNAPQYRITGIDNTSGLITSWFPGNSNWMSNSTPFRISVGMFMSTDYNAQPRYARVYYEATNISCADAQVAYGNLLMRQSPAIVEYPNFQYEMGRVGGIGYSEGCFATKAQAAAYCQSKGPNWDLPTTGMIRELLVYQSNLQYVCNTWVSDRNTPYALALQGVTNPCAQPASCYPVRCRYLAN